MASQQPNPSTNRPKSKSISSTAPLPALDNSAQILEFISSITTLLQKNKKLTSQQLIDWRKNHSNAKGNRYRASTKTVENALNMEINLVNLPKLLTVCFNNFPTTQPKISYISENINSFNFPDIGTIIINKFKEDIRKIPSNKTDSTVLRGIQWGTGHGTTSKGVYQGRVSQVITSNAQTISSPGKRKASESPETFHTPSLEVSPNRIQICRNELLGLGLLFDTEDDNTLYPPLNKKANLQKTPENSEIQQSMVTIQTTNEVVNLDDSIVFETDNPHNSIADSINVSHQDDALIIEPTESNLETEEIPLTNPTGILAEPTQVTDSRAMTLNPLLDQPLINTSESEQAMELGPVSVNQTAGSNSNGIEKTADCAIEAIPEKVILNSEQKNAINKFRTEYNRYLRFENHREIIDFHNKNNSFPNCLQPNRWKIPPNMFRDPVLQTSITNTLQKTYFEITKKHLDEHLEKIRDKIESLDADLHNLNVPDSAITIAQNREKKKLQDIKKKSWAKTERTAVKSATLSIPVMTQEPQNSKKTNEDKRPAPIPKTQNSKNTNEDKRSAPIPKPQREMKGKRPALLPDPPKRKRQGLLPTPPPFPYHPNPYPNPNYATTPGNNRNYIAPNNNYNSIYDYNPYFQNRQVSNYSSHTPLYNNLNTFSNNFYQQPYHVQNSFYSNHYINKPFNSKPYFTNNFSSKNNYPTNPNRYTNGYSKPSFKVTTASSIKITKKTDEIPQHLSKKTPPMNVTPTNNNINPSNKTTTAPPLQQREKVSESRRID